MGGLGGYWWNGEISNWCRGEGRGGGRGNGGEVRMESFYEQLTVIAIA